MTKCKECGQEKPEPTPVIGDMVIYTASSGREYVGVVVNRGTAIPDALQHVALITSNFRGSIWSCHPRNLKVIHGHIHIDR